MSKNEGEGATAALRDQDGDTDAQYQVRLIHKWPPQSPLDKTLASSFYGLELELRGIARPQDNSNSPEKHDDDNLTATEPTVPSSQEAAVRLLFSTDTPSAELLAALKAVSGPFTVVVRNKLAAPSTDDEAQQQMANVQIDNTLLEINGEQFLVDANATGADIYRRLWFVATRASLATPYELTFRRHNLAQLSAKIVPFARRRDVQETQIAQAEKLAVEEEKLPLDIRRKKLFLIQQLDFEREHYLVAHVSAKLQELHTKLMDGVHWQSYDVGKVIWYLHVPTSRLYAQHPLRSHPEARNIIATAQEQVHHAVRKLQRRTRTWQRRRRLLLLIQHQVIKREVEKERQQQQIQQAAQRVQRRFRSHRRRKQLLATIQAAKRREEGLQREQRRVEERRRLEKLRREEEREEEKRQLGILKHEQHRLQLELDDTKLELQQLRRQNEAKSMAQSETQTTATSDEDNAIKQLRKEEQERVQQRLEHLELELRRMKEAKPAMEVETQTTNQFADTTEINTALEQKIAEQQQANQRIAELESTLRRQSTKATTKSITQTTARRGIDVQDEAVDTGHDLEWQRYLTLLRVAVKKKHTSGRTKHTQTENYDGEDTLPRPTQNATSYAPVLRQAPSKWNRFPSWQQDSIGSNSNYSTLLSLKSSSSQLDELDAKSPPVRTFESFFAANLIKQQSPPILLGKQDSTFLPLKSGRTMQEVAPLQLPQSQLPQRLHLREYKFEEPIRPIRGSGNSLAPTQKFSPTRLPYITLRQKKM